MLCWMCALWTLAAPPLVVVDAGHGGSSTGARGVCGVVEKDVTLAVATRVSALLEASGRARVRQTRTQDEDVSLTDRPQLANEAGAALFVSIHANASSLPDVHGVETFYFDRDTRARLSQRHRQTVARENQEERGAVRTDATVLRILSDLRATSRERESLELARALQGRLLAPSLARARGVLSAPFMVLTEAHMPAALVELGFLSNPTECARLGNPAYQRLLARALTSAILERLTTLEGLAQLAPAHVP